MKTQQQWEVENNYAKYVELEEQLDRIRAAKKLLNEEMRKLSNKKYNFVIKQHRTIDIEHNFFGIKVEKDGFTVGNL